MPNNDQPLVLITGANQGLGLATARILAEHHSHHVIIGSRNFAAGEKIALDLRTLGHSATSLQLDLDSPSSIDAAISTLEKDFGYLDILINNAGANFDFDPTLSKHEVFSKTFQTNVVGPAALTEGLLPLLRNARNGPPKVIFVSSSLGSVTLAKDKTTSWYAYDCKAYQSSKAAVNMLMAEFDRSLDGSGAKVNAVCPGQLATSMTSHNGADVMTGTTRIVELATAGPKGVSGTFSNREGTLPF
ncbi:NAD(P)-binding protein [Corynespora cassiicola Philippines]|uniref:NAD(P)-binding protein n=1 Tax=Corynespora cassiicola Philippines TaxID=1448308 RepID=A0A2T2P181_CORCC|nr:NAD(P)-binding protein [Corynespora cassiicola Philippines]